MSTSWYKHLKSAQISMPTIKYTSVKALWRTIRQYLHMHERLCGSTSLPNSVVRHSNFCQAVGCGWMFHGCLNCISIINQTEHLLCALWPFQLLVLGFTLFVPWLISTYRWWFDRQTDRQTGTNIHTCIHRWYIDYRQRDRQINIVLWTVHKAICFQPFPDIIDLFSP